MAQWELLVRPHQAHPLSRCAMSARQRIPWLRVCVHTQISPLSVCQCQHSCDPVSHCTPVHTGDVQPDPPHSPSVPSDWYSSFQGQGPKQGQGDQKVVGRHCHTGKKTMSPKTMTPHWQAFSARKEAVLTLHPRGAWTPLFPKPPLPPEPGPPCSPPSQAPACMM